MISLSENLDPSRMDTNSTLISCLSKSLQVSCLPANVNSNLSLLPSMPRGILPTTWFLQVKFYHNTATPICLYIAYDHF